MKSAIRKTTIAIFLILFGLFGFTIGMNKTILAFSSINGNSLGIIYSTYWAAIVSSIIVGVLTLFGVILTISYYKKSDLNQRRLEYLPYLLVKPIYKNCNCEFSFEPVSKNSENSLEYYFEVKNIGNQYAQLNELYDGRSSMVVNYDIVIPKGESLFFKTKFEKNALLKGNDLIITFTDALNNKYAQNYRLRYPENNKGYFALKVDCAYPKQNEKDSFINQYYDN